MSLIDLYRDGKFILVGRADERFLAWGRGYGDQQKLNPLALAEIIYSFAAFYYEIVLNDFEQIPNKFLTRIELRNMHLDRLKTKLGSYGLGTNAQRLGFNVREAPNNKVSIQKSFDYINSDPRRVAFDLLREIYLWFGIEENKIPYTKTENGLVVIDPEAIKNPKS